MTRPGEADPALSAALDVWHAASHAEVSNIEAMRAVVAAVREQVAQDIEAQRAARFAEYGNEETGPRNYDWALTHATRIARGSS